MSNSAFIQSRKIIHDNDVLFFVNCINQSKFGGRLTIDKNELGSIKVGHSEINDCFNICRNNPRRLSMSWPDDQWLTYVFVVVKQNLAFNLGANIRDESDNEIVKPTPDKYYPLSKWMNIKYSNAKLADIKSKLIKDFMTFVPEEMSCY